MVNMQQDVMSHTGSQDDLELHSDRPKGRELTAKQSAFVEAYVANGQTSARAAAIASGTSPISAGVMGHRNIRNPLILEAIRVAAGDTIKEHLPELINSMIELAMNPKTSAVARVSAFRELADRAGMAVQRGPLVQINNGLTDPRAQAQALIAEIWTEKNTRDARRERTESYVGALIDQKSAIAGGMSDIIDNDAAWRPTAAEAQVGGGERLQGPIPPAYLIPPSPNAHPPAPENFGIAEWREAVRLGTLGGTESGEAMEDMFDD